ncbi:unnamed protein product, partial [marine sediment metagenome]
MDQQESSKLCDARSTSQGSFQKLKPSEFPYLKAGKNVENKVCNGIKRVSEFILNKEAKAQKLNIKAVQAVLIARIRKLR